MIPQTLIEYLDTKGFSFYGVGIHLEFNAKQISVISSQKTRPNMYINLVFRKKGEENDFPVSRIVGGNDCFDIFTINIHINQGRSGEKNSFEQALDDINQRDDLLVFLDPLLITPEATLNAVEEVNSLITRDNFHPLLKESFLNQEKYKEKRTVMGHFFPNFLEKAKTNMIEREEKKIDKHVSLNL